MPRETSTQRKRRLQKQKNYYQLRKAREAKEKMNLDVLLRTQREKFLKAINEFPNQICQVCQKLFYSRQIKKMNMQEKTIEYLPADMVKEMHLFVCDRCHKHLKSTKNTPPPTAYWNNLDPGEIPNEILELTQAEQRLLGRIIPNLKIIRYSGKFGQYGFKGQAILFAYDIFEVSDKLPSLLPRSSQNADLVVVTENLENLEITREFSVSISRLDNALKWLIANNPLYKDVTNNVANYPIDQINFVQPIRKSNVNQKSITEANNFVDHIPVQSSICLIDDAKQPEETDILENINSIYNVNAIKRKTTNNIVNESHELKAEEYAWYFLFPYGRNGLNEVRPVNISPLDYYQIRVLGKDSRFQRNDYLFYALSMYELLRIKQNISVCGKKIHNFAGDGVDDVHLLVRNLRGSHSYWRTALNELVAQIRCLGPPHFFVTLSCNELHWSDMRKALMIADNNTNDPKNLSIPDVQSLIEKYPVVVCRHFMKRINAIMNFILSNNEVLGGKVEDFWWRIEFQNRGAPHLHMVVWLSNMPNFETQVGINKINEVITCAIPHDEELKKIVQAVQIHHHTSTCYKNDNDSCRFKFPRPVSTTTKIVDPNSSEFFRNGGRTIELKRCQGEENVNNYNSILISLWKGNMDIQTCGSNEAIARYIAKYIARSEPNEIESSIREAINHIRNEKTDLSRKMFRICMKLLNHRQVSASECAFRLCHLPLRKSSRRCVFINTRKPEQRYKVLNFSDKNSAIGFCSDIIDRYSKRPTSHENYNMEKMTLMEFAMLFEPYYPKNKNQDELSNECDEDDEIDENPRFIKLTNGTKMKIRKRPAVVRVPYFEVNREMDSYFYSMLVQYYPFRNESELMENFNSSKDSFLAKENFIKQNCELMDVYRKRDQSIENAFNQAHAFEILENEIIQETQDDEENTELNIQMNINQFENAKASMNPGQQELFKFITENIQQQLLQKSQFRIKMFITGGAGTGKTFILKLIREQIQRCYGGNKIVVKACALTGVAARLIDGSTLHSLLKLPVQKDGKIVNPSILSGNYLKQLRLVWKDVEFIIIDEISMVPYELLVTVDSRLKQLKNNENLFGGLNVLLMGDLMQLPPVRGSPIFQQPTRFQPAIDLWKQFSFCELTQNMRQKGDQTFINLLNNVRIGKPTKDDLKILLELLKNNDIGEFSIGKALRVHPTNVQVHDYNQSVLQLYQNSGISLTTIKSQDKFIDSPKSIVNVDIGKIIPNDVNKTGGLPGELTLFVGAKVMLRYNICTENGLVNGAIGEIKEIIWPLFRRAEMNETDIPSVMIDFGDNNIKKIDPITLKFPANFGFGTVERRMIPIILCWSSTVHKMQGSTVQYAVLNLGKKLFAPGQAYVALSRVRSLDGLRIEELNCEKLTDINMCNQAALKEMERLRNLPSYLCNNCTEN